MGETSKSSDLDLSWVDPRNPSYKNIKVVSPGHHFPDHTQVYIKYRGAPISIPGNIDATWNDPKLESLIPTIGLNKIIFSGTIVDGRFYNWPADGPAGRRYVGTIAHGSYFFMAVRIDSFPNAPHFVGRTITVYNNRDQISLFPFRSLKDLVEKKMHTDRMKKIHGYSDLSKNLDLLPDDPESGYVAGIEVEKAKARFENSENPEQPTHFPVGIVDHRDYQLEALSKALIEDGKIQDRTGNRHITNDMLGGRRRRKKRKTRKKKKKKSRGRRRGRRRTRKTKKRRRTRKRK